MQPSVYWQGLQTTWVHHSGRLDQAMDRQTVFCTSWIWHPLSRAWRSVFGCATRGTGGRCGGSIRSLHFTYNSLDFIVFTYGLSVQDCTVVRGKFDLSQGWS